MARKSKPRARRSSIPMWPLYLLLAVLFVLYIYYQQVQSISAVLGALLFLLIAALVVMELINSIGEEGYVRNIIEIAISLGAILLFWFVLKFLLQTNNPLDVVPSCSMLPSLKRGDMILLRGISNISKVHAPVIDVSASAYRSMLNSTLKVQLSCVTYNYTNGRLSISQFLKPGYSVGLYQSPGGVIMPQGNQTGLVTYTCGTRNVMFSNGTVADEAYTSAITIAGTTIIGDGNNTVIVYRTVPGDSFYGAGDSYIVHRVYAMIKVGGGYYALTKGDNNPGLDVQYANYPINESYIEGSVISSIPYIGYLKLILSNQFSQPAGCDLYPIK